VPFSLGALLLKMVRHISFEPLWEGEMIESSTHAPTYRFVVA